MTYVYHVKDQAQYQYRTRFQKRGECTPYSSYSTPCCATKTKIVHMSLPSPCTLLVPQSTKARCIELQWEDHEEELIIEYGKNISLKNIRRNIVKVV